MDWTDFLETMIAGDNMGTLIIVLVFLGAGVAYFTYSRQTGRMV